MKWFLNNKNLYLSSLFFPLAFVIVFALLPTKAGAAEAVTGKALWSGGFGLHTSNQPVCGDFDLDGNIEILLSDDTGKVMLVSAAQGKVLWKIAMKGDPPLAPVAGHFFGNQGTEIALLHLNGQLQILNAASGEIICDALVHNVSGGAARFTLAPTLLPALQTGKKDRLIIVSEDRRLLNISITGKDTIYDEWAGRAVGNLGDMPIQSVAVGLFAASPSNVYGAAFATIGKKVMLVNTSRPSVAPGFSTPINSMELMDQPPLGLKENKNGLIFEGVLSDPQTNFLRFSLDLSGSSPSVALAGPLENRVQCTQRAGVPPIMADINGDGMQDTILANEQQIVVIDGQTGWSMSGFESYGAVKKFITPPRVCPHLNS